MQGCKLYFRLAMLAGFTLLISLVMLGRLYNLQIVNGESYSQQAERTITRTTVIPAARGQILDRHGRVLVSNRVGYRIGFDYLRMGTEVSANLLSMVAITEDMGIDYVDTLPVTNPPFAYLEDMDSRQSSRLARYLEKMEWEGISAAELIKKLRQHYDLPDELSDADARTVAGIRWEIELRTKFYDIPPYYFASDVSIEYVTALKERAYPGVIIELTPARDVLTDSAANIIGRIGPIYEDELEAYMALGYDNDAQVGKSGAEKAFESYLKGTPGLRTEVTNASGKTLSVTDTKEAQPGGNVMLTIDIRFQEMCERILEENILRMRAEGELSRDHRGMNSEGGAIVVTDVNTGEILALANYPTYSQRTFLSDYSALMEDSLKPMLNRAIAGVYQPGSIFKMCTAIAALETGNIKPTTRILDKGKYMFYAAMGYTPVCSIYGSGGGSHGSVDVANALKVSCNYFFYEAGRLTTIDNIAFYASQMGLGKLSGIELAAEEKTGTLASREYTDSIGVTWYPGDTIQAAIGQGYNTFTPLQMSAYTATVANGGIYYRPHILLGVKSYDYQYIEYEQEPEILADLRSDSFVPVQEGMRLAAESGTARTVFAQYPVKVAAKTGTAEVREGIENNSVFVAYAPYDNPEIAVAVVVEKGGAGSLAAPIARDVFNAYFGQKLSAQKVVKENELLP